jgi:hypothetical protein
MTDWVSEPAESRSCIESAESKFRNYVPSEQAVKHRSIEIVEELKRHNVFAERHPCPTRAYLNDSDALSLFSVLHELGYREIIFVHKGNSFLTMRATFRFSDVVVKIGRTANPNIESDPCVREAAFFLDSQGEYGKIYKPKYCPYDQVSSSADVLAIGVGSNTYTIATAQMADRSLIDKLNEIAGNAQSAPDSSFIRDVIDLLFQILKVYQEVHLNNIALVREPKKLMMLCIQDGHGCRAVSRVNFQGKSYALVVVSAAYTQKQGFVYHNRGSVCCDDIKKMCKTVQTSIKKHNSDKKSRPSLCVLTGFGIASFFANKKELVRLGHNSAEKKESQMCIADVSGCRRDLQLVAATFIEILAGHVSPGECDVDCSHAFVQEQDIDLDAKACEVCSMIHSRAAWNRKLDVDHSLLPLAESNNSLYSAMPLEYKELMKLLWRLKYSTDITATAALNSHVFDRHKEDESWLHDPWRQQDIPDWSLLPHLVTQNYWRRTIFPKCQHYYVKGGPYDAGGGKVLNLKAVWLVYECCSIGEMTGHNAWQRTVRLAEDGKKGDFVAVYACPLIFRSSLDFEYLDFRWTIHIKSSDDWLLNGRTCGRFNPHLAVEKQQVACYINSSKDKQGKNHRASLQHDFCRKRFQLPKGQNCTVFYPHPWNRKISNQKFIENPWLGTIAFKLTSDQPRYEELAFSYDWYKHDQEYRRKHMKETSTWHDICLRIFKFSERC